MERELSVMDISEALQKFAALKKDSQAADKVLHKLASFDTDRQGNLTKIKREIVKLEAILIRLRAYSPDIINVWFEQFKQQISETERILREKFGASLAAELESKGRSLTGQYPELRAGLFTIEVDFDGGNATVWYGPKQERLAKCRLSVQEIGQSLTKFHSGLGRGLPAEEFLVKLRDAHSRAGGDSSKAAPIIRVLADLAFVLQESRFRRDPRQANYRGYSRADFSYDLFRLRNHLDAASGRERLRLSAVATPPCCSAIT